MYTADKYKELTLTASAYNRKTSIELPCDSELGEVIDAFEALVVGLGYSLESWKDEIIERGNAYTAEELRKQKDIEFYTNRIDELEKKLYESKLKEIQSITDRLVQEG